MLRPLNALPLDDILTYQHDDLIGYFCHHHPSYSFLEAKELFSDLLAWMWLQQQRQSMGKKTYLFGPLLVLDDMWHVFILHTRDYMTFCERYFGEYFHHEIEPIGSEHQVEEDELTDFLEDCFNYLGASWVERRFHESLGLG